MLRYYRQAILPDRHQLEPSQKLSVCIVAHARPLQRQDAVICLWDRPFCFSGNRGSGQEPPTAPLSPGDPHICMHLDLRLGDTQARQMRQPPFPGRHAAAGVQGVEPSRG
jgi:hypothetical protein